MDRNIMPVPHMKSNQIIQLGPSSIKHKEPLPYTYFTRQQRLDIGQCLTRNAAPFSYSSYHSMAGQDSESSQPHPSLPVNHFSLQGKNKLERTLLTV